MTEQTNNTTVTITLPDGTSVTFKAELLAEYRKRCFEQLTKVEAAQQEFKGEIEALVDGIRGNADEAPKKLKSYLSKYMKRSYKAEVKAAKQEAELFEKFDEIVKS